MTLAVVHLVRRQNGSQPLRTFLDAYSRHPAGVEHTLVLALKGFDDRAAAAVELELAARFRPEALLLPDDGFDLMAYFRSAARLGYERYCFVNSFSRPLVDGWLMRLAGALDDPGVGLAGATGSWASQLDYLRYQLGLPSAYAEVYEDRETTRQAFLELAREADGQIRDRGRIVAKLLFAGALARQARTFLRFPAPHVRTNALAVRREILLAMRFPAIRSKLDAYRIESGRDSLTARVIERGLRAVVVGRDGVCYHPDRWANSETFWQGTQRNLLVADNRTEDYQRAEPQRRLLLARFAWGKDARTDTLGGSPQPATLTRATTGHSPRVPEQDTG